MIFRTLFKRLAVLCALVAAASSCVDHAYDFDRTDPSVTLGGDDLTLPLGSTDRFLVGDLVSKHFGNLFVLRDDGSYNAHYDADPVDFVFAGLKDYDGARPFRKYCNFPISTTFSLYNVPRSGVVFDERGEADLSGLLPAKIGLGTRSKGQAFSIPRMPDQLLGLESITLTETSQVKVTFSIPDCLLTDGTVTPTVQVDLSQFFQSRDSEDGIVTVSTELNKDNGYTSTLYIPLYKLVLDPEAYDEKTHTLTMEARIGFTGSVAVSNPKTTRARYQSAGQNNQLQLTVELLNLTCESIRGRYDYTITQLQTQVDLRSLTGEILDRIGDKNAVFDFDDPEIILDVESNISVPTYALVNLTARKGRNKIGEMKDIVVPFPIAPPGESITDKIRLAKTKHGETDVVLDFTELIRLVPDEITVDINGYTYPDQTGEVRVGQVYQAYVTPRVNIPLSFGPAMQLTVRDTLDLPEDLGGLLLDNKLTLLGEMTNTLPLQLEFGVEMTDALGNRLLEPVSQTIAAGGTSSLSIPMNNIAGAKVEDLSKALLTFKVAGTDDNRLVRSSDYLQAALKLQVPGGYHISLQKDAQ